MKCFMYNLAFEAVSNLKVFWNDFPKRLWRKWYMHGDKPIDRHADSRLCLVELKRTLEVCMFAWRLSGKIVRCYIYINEKHHKKACCTFVKTHRTLIAESELCI